MTSYAPVQLAFSSFEPKSHDKEKAPIIFLHGMAASKEHWEDIPQTVSDATNRKVYAIDARNHGDSEWSDNFDIDSNPYDLVNFMDSVDAPKAILVGHSMGGITSMKTALHWPERVEKLIIEDISVKEIPPEILGMLTPLVSVTKAAIAQIPPEVDEDTAHTMIADYVVQNFVEDLPQEYKQHVSTSAIPRFPLKRTNDGRYAFKTNFEAIIKRLAQSQKLMGEYKGVYEGPAYFIYGKNSLFLVGKDEDLLKQFFPKAELIGIENAAHSVHTDCTKEFVDHLLKCLLN